MSKTKTDWKLPTMEELVTLINYSKVNPACELKDTFSDDYWSSSTNINATSLAWYVNFSYGNSDGSSKANNYYVRCVRISKKGKLQWSKTSKEKMTWKEAVEYAENLKAKVYK